MCLEANKIYCRGLDINSYFCAYDRLGGYPSFLDKTANVCGSVFSSRWLIDSVCSLMVQPPSLSQEWMPKHLRTIGDNRSNWILACVAGWNENRCLSDGLGRGDPLTTPAHMVSLVKPRMRQILNIEYWPVPSIDGWRIDAALVSSPRKHPTKSPATMVCCGYLRRMTSARRCT